VARSFRQDQDISVDEVHGTACAEIVHDMAPNAELFLVNFSTSLEMLEAVDWIIDQGVQIISASFGSNANPMDGTGLACEGVKKAYDRGVAWINAAGNEAEKHWAGTFSDPDGNGDHNFSDSDELLQFRVPAYSSFKVIMRWNDWGTWDGNDYSGSSQDYDLWLYIYSGGRYRLVAKSDNYQSGSQWPIEYIPYGYYAYSATTWAIAIKKFDATRAVKFDCFIDPVYAPLEYNVPAGSLSSPGDSPFAITVGAVDWSDDSYHSYSSQGPTADGRIKPDLCAPSAVSTVSYSGEPFYGTSSACPHVAGAFALLKCLTPYSLDQIKDIIDARAIDLGASGKDNKFGLGRLSLSNRGSSTR
jgi:subtilisin family serine protease